ncbi:MAG: hypothetical protein DIJKHBIC_01892 [Thermoanaerobaculia bacterium]|nr:hypothetical protein [Thermoanaerobaculia bacterium]
MTVLLIVLTGTFLLANLRTYSGALLVWEPAVLEGLEDAFLARQSIPSYLLKTLTWDDGLVSKGDWSLLYGAPAYALLTTLGFNAVSLRLPAVIAALLTLAAAGWLGRRLLGPGGALALASVLALSPGFLYYGRYGTSLAATTLTVLLAAGLTILFLEATDRYLPRALLLAASMALATLHYAPGRLAVLFLVFFLPVGVLLGPREERAAKFRALAVLVLCLAAFWGAQKLAGRSQSFLMARGEQVFNFFTDPTYISGYLGRAVAPDKLTAADKLTIAKNVAFGRLPELVRVLSPSLTPAQPMDLIGSDPPRVPFLPLPLLLLALVGFARSMRHPLKPRHLIPVGVVIALSGPVLLTTRVDAHRLSLMVIPIGLWAAEAAVVLWHSLPRLPGGILALAIFGAGVPYVTRPLHRLERPGTLPLASSLDAAIDRAGRPVMLAIAADHTVVGLSQLKVLELERRARLEKRTSGPGVPTLLPERVLLLLRQGGREGKENVAEELVAILSTAPVLLGPMQEFGAIGEVLRKAGLESTPAGSAQVPLLLVSHRTAPLRGRAPGGPPTPSSLEMSPERLVFVSDLVPVKAESDFTPHRMDATWDGSPLVVGGQTYQKGIGVHARCSMTFAVPEGARRFQARIGLAPGAAGCPDARVGYFVKDQDGNYLFSNPSLRFTDAPEDVSVPLEGVRELTLVASEGGNGRDCDHANWALASFVMVPGAAPPLPARTPGVPR